MSDTGLRAGWEAAYRRAEYRIRLPRGELVLRVGTADAAADQRLREEAGVLDHWAVLTPCNPQSRRHTAEQNAALLEELAEIAESLSLRRVRSVNTDPRGEWPDEPGVLLCDPPAGFAEELGRRFRQNAILAANLGEAPRLVWLE
jgi:hypothetical protein